MSIEMFAQFADRNGGELIGVAGLIGLVLFAFDYNRHARWRKNPEGRAVMYLALGLIATITLLVVNGWLGSYPGRVFVEIAVYSPLAFACWYLRHTLRQSLGLPSRWIIRVPKKSTTEAEEAVEEDTRPTP